jgi:hypothetical protein
LERRHPAGFVGFSAGGTPALHFLQKSKCDDPFPEGRARSKMEEADEAP